MDSPLLYLNKFFSYDEFRLGQLEIIESIIAGNDTMAIMPTGGGKSICYQIPALMLQGTTIVVSPLISLMKDQVDTLNAKNIPAAFINSTLSNDDLNIIINHLKKDKIKMLYLAPERIESKAFIDVLKYLNVPLIAIDEAHCISEWGHDFRPAYRKVHTLKEYLPNSIVAAFTATATEDVQEDIVYSLKLKRANVFVKGFDRPNLNYIVKEVDNKNEEILKLTKNLDGSAIIYAGSRKRVEQTYNFLKGKINGVSYYHAGLNEKFRQIQQDRFLKNESNIIVATNAFGMGIDKSDVRKVIHIDLTSTLESYYQESGRAGRDNKKAECIMLYHTSDRGLQDYFIQLTYPKYDDILKVYNFLYDKTSTKIGETASKGFEGNHNDIAFALKMPNYLTQNILSLLEKNNIISSGKASNWAYIKINTDRNRVKEYFELTSEENKSVLEAFLRNVRISNSNDYTIVYFDELIRKYNLNKEHIDKAVNSFIYNDIIYFRGYKPKEAISLLMPRYNNRDIPINFESLLKRKEFSIDKLNQVEQYAKTNLCKRNFLLAYFGEEREDTCGRCSSCTGSKSINNEMISYIKNMISSLYKETRKEFNKSQSWKILSGSKAQEIYINNFDQLSSYGSLIDVSKAEFDKSWNEIHSLEKLKIEKHNYSTNLDNLKLLVSSKKSLKEIITLTNSNKTTIINNLLSLVKYIDAETLFNEVDVKKVKRLLKENPNLSSRDLQFLLGNKIDFNETKLLLKIITS